MSTMAHLMLPAVDRVEILTVLDLSLDLLMAGSDTVRRVDIAGTLGEGRSTLRAEHGFSSLVTVVHADRKASFLFDTGMTKDSLLHNIDVLEIRPTASSILLTRPHGTARRSQLPKLDVGRAAGHKDRPRPKGPIIATGGWSL